MQFPITFASLIVIAATAVVNPVQQDYGRCEADSCARVVTGSRAGLPSTRLADCSSFMHVTVTPAPVYSTVVVVPVETDVSTITTDPVFEYTTVTDTVYTVVRATTVYTSAANHVARHVQRAGPTTVRHTTVPMYATSACCPASRYSSACSCAGVTRSTTTAATPTHTVTEMASETVTTEVFVAASTTIEKAVTQTQVAVETGYPCGASVPGNGIYTFRNYKVVCGQRAANGTIAQAEFDAVESECLRSCNSVKYCSYAEYQFSSGKCNLYYDNAIPILFIHDADWDGLSLVN